MTTKEPERRPAADRTRPSSSPSDPTRPSSSPSDRYPPATDAAAADPRTRPPAVDPTAADPRPPAADPARGDATPPNVPTTTTPPNVPTTTTPPNVPTATSPTLPAARRPDHAAIERLIDTLLPALAARLGVGDLDELEVREDGWRVRLRRSTSPAAGGATVVERPSSATPSQPQPSARVSGPRGTGTSNPPRAGGAGLVGIGPAPGGWEPERTPPPRTRARRAVASPAVGFVRLAPSFAVGKRVRAGDRLGAVDVLGVPHDILAPSDGLVVEILVEPGQPVEYGQELGSLESFAADPGERSSESAAEGAESPGSESPGTESPGSESPGTESPAPTGGS